MVRLDASARSGRLASLNAGAGKNDTIVIACCAASETGASLAGKQAINRQSVL